LKLPTLQIGAFAQAIGVAKCTVRKWIKMGRLPGVHAQRNGYYSIPAHYIDEVKRGELPLAAREQRKSCMARYRAQK
jgi:predicted site-specific integrase-resolvase